ncbi:MAG: ABC transporter permease, partial [Bacteroidota bacterium]
MYWLLFKQFFRTKACQVGVLLILLMGVISIMIGKQFVDNHNRISSELMAKQKAHIERNVSLHAEDPGLLLYYLKFTLVNDLNPLAGLSIGQRDLNPGIQNVTILTLEGQKYNSDLVNPVRLLFGNFDFSFLVVYMFPLLIIAFSYNLLSEEKEKGTWKLIRVAARSRSKFLLSKLSMRAMVVIGLMSGLLLIAAVLLNIPFNSSLLTFY